MYLGIEIGGTKLQLGVGPGDGTLTALWRGEVDVARGADGIREQILKETPALLQHAGLKHEDVRGIGVGFGGPVDDADQTVIKSHQIMGWDGFPLAQWLTELLGWPVALGNDADVAGLAEALFGAGKGLSPIFYITIGSGIGGGLIINGEIYRGCGRGAAEIGHMEFLDAFYNHDSKTIENHASGWSIGRAFEFFTDNPPDLATLNFIGGPPTRDSFHQQSRFSAEDVAHEALAGNAVALRVLHHAWVNLATAICNMIALIGPRRIVVGGGVSLMGEWVLFEPLRKLVAVRVFKPFANCYDIVPAALGEEVVVHGALALARKRFGGGC